MEIKRFSTTYPQTLMKYLLALLIALPISISAQSTVLYSDTLPYRGITFEDFTLLPTFIEINKLENNDVWIHFNLTPDGSEVDNSINIEVKRVKKRSDGLMLKLINNPYRIIRVIQTEDGVVVMHRWQNWLVFHNGLKSGGE